MQVGAGRAVVSPGCLKGWNSHGQSQDPQGLKETLLPETSHPALAMARREREATGSARRCWERIPQVSLKALCALPMPPLICTGSRALSSQGRDCRSSASPCCQSSTGAGAEPRMAARSPWAHGSPMNLNGQQPQELLWAPQAQQHPAEVLGCWALVLSQLQKGHKGKGWSGLGRALPVLSTGLPCPAQPSASPPQGVPGQADPSGDVP